MQRPEGLNARDETKEGREARGPKLTGLLMSHHQTSPPLRSPVFLSKAGLRQVYLSVLSPIKQLTLSTLLAMPLLLRYSLTPLGLKPVTPSAAFKRSRSSWACRCLRVLGVRREGRHGQVWDGMKYTAQNRFTLQRRE